MQLGPTDIAAGGSTGGLIRKVLLANADTLCAAASPLMDLDDSSLYVAAGLLFLVLYHITVEKWVMFVDLKTVINFIIFIIPGRASLRGA